MNFLSYLKYIIKNNTLLVFLMLAIYGYDPSKGFIAKKKV